MIKIQGEIIAAVLCIMAAVFMAIEARNFPAGGNLFPLFICVSMVVIACFMLLRTLFFPSLYKRGAYWTLTGESVKPFVITTITVFYVLSMYVAGFYTASVFYFILMCRAIGVLNYRKIGLVALAVFPLMYVFFELVLQTGMPKGYLL